MKNMDNINLSTRSCVSARQPVNRALNVLGVMFFVTFLGYIAFHCF